MCPVFLSEIFNCPCLLLPFHAQLSQNCQNCKDLSSRPIREELSPYTAMPPSIHAGIILCFLYKRLQRSLTAFFLRLPCCPSLYPGLSPCKLFLCSGTAALLPAPRSSAPSEVMQSYQNLPRFSSGPVSS